LAGLTAEFATYSFSRTIPTGSAEGGFQTYLFGPRLNLRRNYFVPFLEFLIGGMRADGQVTGDARQSSFALAAGGGVDIVFTKHIAWRFAQIDYLMTNATGINLNASGRQDNLRAGTGLVLRWVSPIGAATAVGPAYRFVLCESEFDVCRSNDPVAIHVTASSPASLPLTYGYTATGARWKAPGRTRDGTHRAWL